MTARRMAPLFAALWLSACSVANFDIPGAAGDDDAYAARHPYYAEFCALSQIKKIEGFGADIRGQIGGHAVFYLNGACRVAGQDYPVIAVCDGAGGPPDGVGLSMNSHFRNAKWVATPGRDFFYRGGLETDAPVDRDAYARVQDQARRLGIYDGVAFHPESFDVLPAGWAAGDPKYEVSIATDYAISFGRGRYCARLPVSRVQMGAMVDFLNAQNAPYRRGDSVFEWSVFRDNCIHLAHNALAAAGLWAEWPTNRPLLVSMIDFPVPKNEFVNLMRRTGDLRLLEFARVYRDPALRRAVLQYGRLPVVPGALATSHGPQRPNSVYETELKLVFYDEPNLGPYQGWFDAIFTDPAALNPDANAAHVTAAYHRAEASRRPLAWWQAQPPYENDPAFPAFYDRFYRALADGRRPGLVTRID
ncbi:MAG: hypothetical protein H7Z10_05915 [Gemmatimonadaceae bacterium]|nr:hypothetical protein [Acetobacteraceae bacterium]